MTDDSTTKTDFESLRASIASRFRGQLREAVESALRAADDVLFDWAYTQSLKNKTTQDCIDLMRMLRLRRERFVETFLDHFDQGSDEPEKSDGTLPELTLELKSDEQQELECAVQNFVTTVTNHSEALRSDLIQRLQTLDKESGVDSEQRRHSGLAWRISTEHVAATFRDAAATLDLDAGMQIILFKLFERCATPALTSGYSLIEKDLSAAGIVAHRPQPRGERDAKPTNSSNGAAGETIDTDSGLVGGIPNTTAEQGMHAADSGHFLSNPAQLTGAFAQQLAGFGPAQGSMSAPPGAASVPPATGFASGGGTGSASTTAASATTGANLQGHGHGPSMTAGAMQAAERFAQSHLQRVDQLLGGYAGIAGNADQAQALLQPMVIPLMRLSAAQPEILTDPHHRIRELLDQLLATGTTIEHGEEEESTAIVSELQEVFSRLADAAQLPRNLDAQHERLPQAEQVQASLAETRRLRSERRLEEARSYATDQVDGVVNTRTLIRGGDAWIRTVMIPYLAWVWVSKGVDSKMMSSAQTLLEQLADSLDPQTAVDMRDEFESLAERTAQTLHNAGAKLQALNRIMVRLRERFSAACEASVSLDELMGDQRFQDRDAAPPSQGAVPLSTPSTSTKPDAEPAATTASSTAEPAQATEAPVDATPERADDWLSRHLRAGDWWRIALKPGDRGMFARLESVPHTGGDLRFAPIESDALESYRWSEIIASVLAGHTRPLHPKPGFTTYLRRHAA